MLNEKEVDHAVCLSNNAKVLNFEVGLPFMLVQLKKENEVLMERVTAAELHHESISNSSLLVSISCNLGLFRDWLKSLFHFLINHYN